MGALSSWPRRDLDIQFGSVGLLPGAGHLKTASEEDENRKERDKEEIRVESCFVCVCVFRANASRRRRVLCVCKRVDPFHC